MKKLLFIFLALSILSCNNSEKKIEKIEKKPVQKENKYAELDKKVSSLFGTLPNEAVNPNNPITPEKVALGKSLYFDNILSVDNVQSCNTCHNLDTYGVDNMPTSKGDKGKFGTRNSPTTFNAAFHVAQFWDGREPDVEAQAGGPVLNPVEMGMPSEEEVIKKLSNVKKYQEMFAKAFPEEKNPITYDNMKKAIGAFERKLVTHSKFDEYVSGKTDALTDQEKQGLQTFIDAGCTACHSGPLLGGQLFQKFGIYGDYWTETKSKNIDNGRYDVTKKEEDKYVFKVPSLRNIEKTYPYFHDGSVADLKDAVRIMAKLQSNKNLTDKQVDDIVVFLKTLTGDIDESLKQQKQ